MRINTNLIAQNTYIQYTSNNNKIAKSVEKLSSGYAINSAADNAAGLSISEKMRAQIRGLEQASANAQDGISLIQTAEGALSSSTEILQRMREIAVQSASDTNENEIDREALQDEFIQLQAELDEISKTTTFNKKNLLDGSLATSTAKLANVNLAKSGLSVELGKAAAGHYVFSVGIQQESAEITAQQATFIATSSSDSFTVGTVTNNLSPSSLANGNYTISAEYDEDNKQMIFTAVSDKGQQFIAILSDSELADAFGTEGGVATLSFGNGEGNNAFSFTLTPTSTYDTSSTSTMSTLAADLTDALKLSATGGVDAQAATYGVYAHLTGAESVKLEAGMSSVTFSNGIKINFNELTTSDVSVITSTTTAPDPINIAEHQVTVTGSSGGSVNGTINLSDLFPGGETLGEGTVYTLNIGGVSVNYTQASNDTADSIVQALATQISGITVQDEASQPNDVSLTFTADGTSIKIGSATLSGNVNAQLTVSASAVNNTPPSTSITGNYVNTFGSTPSEFDVVNKAGAGLTFQVGANEGDELTINIDKMDSNYLGVASAKVTTQKAASSAISAVDNAINRVSSQRAYLGAIQNRLEYKINNLEISTENLTSAESQIRDVDMAKEMTNFTNANILQQAATAMLAQANALPQNVLSLIGG
ncbi:MAG: flagellin [Eubacteriales bacterium]|jgi:flagellin